MSKQFTFNYCIPREYNNNGQIEYCLCRGNEHMDVATLEEIQKQSDVNKPKNAQPWGQVFNNGFRVVTESLNYADWTGITFNDIDAKWFYRYKKQFDVQKLFNGIIKTSEMLFYYNFYACHITNSGQGYRIFWYWDCERTKDNFMKCCLLTEKYAKELFYAMGKDTKDIIDYDYYGHKVLDRCSTSIMQGFYVTTNKIYYSSFVNNNDFGSCDIEDISLEDIYKVNESTYIKSDSSANIKYLSSDGAVKKDEIRYYPHQHRRCLYEALMVLFHDKTQVDVEWKKVCAYLPQENGHDTAFYINEPIKNKWFERFNKHTVHRCDWLKPFGYIYLDDSEYIYAEQFKSSWKKHCIKEVNDMCAKEMMARDLYKSKEEIKKFIKDTKTINGTNDVEGLKKKINYIINKTYNNIFDTFYDSMIEDEDNKIELDEIRKSYYKTRWSNKDFIYLCNGYNIPKDIVTYKMYADFYYRDENNMPTIKYDVMEDDILTYGYWPETGKMQYHTFKYGNEYTHWKNNDTFCNSCTKTDLLEAVNKYVPRWHKFHTIQDYINSLDLSTANEEMLETWAIRYFKADDTKLTREISKKFFIAAVKKMMIEDPVKFVFQHILFLQGATGCGKTFFLVTMFTINGKMFILNKIDPNGKDNEIGPLIAKNWLIQFGESENLKKISVNAAKEFVDRINLGMKYQKKYENEQTTIYPRIVAARTSNDEILFNDPSVDTDRRNWLIVCKTPMNSCGPELRKQIEEEKDILWATAYKLYLDDPDQDLELSNEAFDELGKLQEQYKLVTKEDIDELYDDIFNRNYLVNYKGEILDEASFREMIKRSEESLENRSLSTAFFEDNKGYEPKHIKCIPVKWLKDYIMDIAGSATWKEFKKKMMREGWNYGTHGWRQNTKKCWFLK